MAWNEPGGGKDPWGGKGGGSNNDGPPDLDEALKKFQDKLNGLFGGGSGGGNKSGGGRGNFGGIAGVVVVIALVIYLLAGFYQVGAQERAVVLQFGAFKEIKDPGLRWNPPLISKVFKENVTQERQYATQGLMLTVDESIVELPLTVQYNVDDVKSFVLNIRNPDASLQQATDSALRHVVGSTELNQVLSGGRQLISEDVRRRVQTYLDKYESGIAVRDVNIQEGRPPQEVRSAFDDVIRAREDEERFKNEAQAYANRVIPEARGRAQRMLDEAEAYRAEIVARAEGESERFGLLLAEYNNAPQVTRERLYIETVEAVLSNTSKIFIDVEGGNNMMYLPLDRLMQQSQTQGGSSGSGGQAFTPELMRQLTEGAAGRDAPTRSPQPTLRREVR
ncbi:FtsH protease activity modulator HflK [Marinimicrobium alkaliphilum]|uniref:FtsH protease activity modulator HflK n=1 Tax=Marinimicrobium alkaliphilum TaxID=2202654 RepID=UPI000DB957D0|nr:FtsH protease activity modulator HflK [Marinimicrobium alkaliphilum]